MFSLIQGKETRNCIAPIWKLAESYIQLKLWFGNQELYSTDLQVDWDINFT